MLLDPDVSCNQMLCCAVLCFARDVFTDAGQWAAPDLPTAGRVDLTGLQQQEQQQHQPLSAQRDADQDQDPALQGHGLRVFAAALVCFYGVLSCVQARQLWMSGLFAVA